MLTIRGVPDKWRLSQIFHLSDVEKKTPPSRTGTDMRSSAVPIQRYRQYLGSLYQFAHLAQNLPQCQVAEKLQRPGDSV